MLPTALSPFPAKMEPALIKAETAMRAKLSLYTKIPLTTLLLAMLTQLLSLYPPITKKETLKAKIQRGPNKDQFKTLLTTSSLPNPNSKVIFPVACTPPLLSNQTNKLESDSISSKATSKTISETLLN
jgi:hypothetical protein